MRVPCYAVVCDRLPSLPTHPSLPEKQAMVMWVDKNT